MPRSFSFMTVFAVLCPLTVSAEDLLLEDYQARGIFKSSRFANDFEDSLGRKNTSKDAGDYAEVKWAAKWSGLESTGPTRDLSRYKTFQVDVMVKPGQPVEEETNFYFQLLHHTPVGYSYWEFFVPQNKVKADGKWYRVQFPFTKFYGNAGDGADKPKGFATIHGIVGGMTYDEDGDQFEFKTANFDNFVVSETEVDDLVVKLVPDTQ